MTNKTSLIHYHLLPAMAASPMHTEHGDLQSHDKWANSGDHSGEPMGPAGDGAAPNNGPAGDDRAANDTAHPEYARSNGGGDAGSNQSGTVVYREKQVKVLRSSPVSCLALLVHFACGPKGDVHGTCPRCGPPFALLLAWRLATPVFCSSTALPICLLLYDCSTGCLLCTI